MNALCLITGTIVWLLIGLTVVIKLIRMAKAKATVDVTGNRVTRRNGATAVNTKTINPTPTVTKPD